FVEAPINALQWARRESNPHEVLPHGILNPERLPFRHSPVARPQVVRPRASAAASFRPPHNTTGKRVRVPVPPNSLAPKLGDTRIDPRSSARDRHRCIGRYGARRFLVHETTHGRRDEARELGVTMRVAHWRTSMVVPQRKID